MNNSLPDLKVILPVMQVISTGFISDCYNGQNVKWSLQGGILVVTLKYVTANAAFDGRLRVGKDTLYIVDFENGSEGVLAAAQWNSVVCSMGHGCVPK